MCLPRKKKKEKKYSALLDMDCSALTLGRAGLQTGESIVFTTCRKFMVASKN